MKTTLARSTLITVNSDVIQISRVLQLNPPFSEADLLRYIEIEKNRLSPVTIKKRLSSVVMHAEQNSLVAASSSPLIKEKIRELMKGYFASKKRAALYGDKLKKVINRCPDTLIGKRDKAIILFGFSCGGLRRSEIAEIRVSDLSVKDGLHFYFLPKSKTDQEAKGRFIPVSKNAMSAVNEWTAAAKITKGYLFRRIIQSSVSSEGLSAWTIGEIVKNRCNQAGFNSRYYGAHSLRVGFVTAALESGASEQDVMLMSGHKTNSMVRHYFRSDNPWKFNKALSVMQSLDI